MVSVFLVDTLTPIHSYNPLPFAPTALTVTNQILIAGGDDHVTYARHDLKGWRERVLFTDD